MPLGSKNAGTSTGAESGEKPVLFQQYFKNGNRTYASQVKISQIGKKYLVLTEGHRDPKTQELKKHTICVFEQDLKQFFAILQETVLYLRSAKDPAATVPGVMEKVAPAKPARPPIVAKPVAPVKQGDARGTAARAPVLMQKPAAPTKAPAQTKPSPRPAGTRPMAAPAAKAAYRSDKRPGTRQERGYSR